MIQIYFKTLRSKQFKLITTPRRGSWINVENATEEDLVTISKLIKTEREDLMDALDIYEIPRLEPLHPGVLCFVRNPSNVTESLYTETLAIILTPYYLITISPQHNPLLSNISKHRDGLATTQLNKLLLFILIQVVREFMNQIRKVSHAVYVQRNTMRLARRRDIIVLLENEEILNQYLSALIPMESALKSLLSGRFLKWYEDDEDLFEDLLNELSQAIDICKVSLKSIISLRDSYQIIFTNNLNDQIKFLTSFTIILTIPTVIGSFYGMNVILPYGDHRLAFIMIVGGTLVLMISAVLLFIRKKWL